jgi:predicted enzyme related to lactoylglutathione lyase
MIEMHIYIDVDDLERGVAFYGRAFGLRLGRRLDANWVEMVGAGVPVHLLEKPNGSPACARAGQRRDFGRHWTPVHLDFVVAALEPAVARAEAAGARLERPIETHPWGRLANLADPFGNGVDLIELNAGGYDRIAPLRRP